MKPQASPPPVQSRNQVHSSGKGNDIHVFPRRAQHDSRSPASSGYRGGGIGEFSSKKRKHPFLEVSVCYFREPQTALGSAQTPVCRMWTGSENEINLLFPSKFQCGQTFSWWPQQAPLVPSEDGNQNFQCPQPAGAVWAMSRDSPSQPHSQKENRCHCLQVAPGKPRVPPQL